MKNTLVEIRCDICKSQIQVKKEKIGAELIETVSGELDANLQVIFLTDQNDGSSCNPYLTKAKIDICDGCLGCILKGSPLYGDGAMGNNRYYFKPVID